MLKWKLADSNKRSLSLSLSLEVPFRLVYTRVPPPPGRGGAASCPPPPGLFPPSLSLPPALPSLDLALFFAVILWPWTLAMSLPVAALGAAAHHVVSWQLAVVRRHFLLRFLLPVVATVGCFPFAPTADSRQFGWRWFPGVVVFWRGGFLAATVEGSGVGFLPLCGCVIRFVVGGVAGLVGCSPVVWGSHRFSLLDGSGLGLTAKWGCIDWWRSIRHSTVSL